LKKFFHSLWDIMRRMAKRCFAHRVSRSAAEITYYLLFTLFPLVIFAYSVVATLGIPIEEILERLSPIMPLDVADLLREYLTYVGGMSRSFMLYAGSVLALYMSFKAITSLNYAVHKAEGENITQSATGFLRSIIPSLALMAVIIASLILFGISRRVYGYIAVFFELSGHVKLVADLVRYAAGPVILFFTVSLYYFIANGKKYPYKRTMPGAFFAIVLWYIFSLGFVFYVDRFGSYTTLYGSLASIIVLMVWFHTTSAALIMGAELNAVLRERESRQ